MLVGTNDLSAAQAKGTQKTLDDLLYLLNYATTNLDAKIRHNASGMILLIGSDGSYFLAPNAKIRAGGYFYLLDLTAKGTKNALNGPIPLPL